MKNKLKLNLLKMFSLIFIPIIISTFIFVIYKRDDNFADDSGTVYKDDFIITNYDIKLSSIDINWRVKKANIPVQTLVKVNWTLLSVSHNVIVDSGQISGDIPTSGTIHLADLVPSSFYNFSYTVIRHDYFEDDELSETSSIMFNTLHPLEASIGEVIIDNEPDSKLTIEVKYYFLNLYFGSDADPYKDASLNISLWKRNPVNNSFEIVQFDSLPLINEVYWKNPHYFDGVSGKGEYKIELRATYPQNLNQPSIVDSRIFILDNNNDLVITPVVSVNDYENNKTIIDFAITTPFHNPGEFIPFSKIDFILYNDDFENDYIFSINYGYNVDLDTGNTIQIGLPRIFPVGNDAKLKVKIHRVQDSVYTKNFDIRFSSLEHKIMNVREEGGKHKINMNLSSVTNFIFNEITIIIYDLNNSFDVILSQFSYGNLNIELTADTLDFDFIIPGGEEIFYPGGTFLINSYVNFGENYYMENKDLGNLKTSFKYKT